MQLNWALLRTRGYIRLGTAFAVAQVIFYFLPAPFSMERELNWIVVMCGLVFFIVGALLQRAVIFQQKPLVLAKDLVITLTSCAAATFFGIKYLILWNSGGIMPDYYIKAMLYFGITISATFFLIGYWGIYLPRPHITSKDTQ